MAYKSNNHMFRDLSDKEELEFRNWAQLNYKKGENISSIWHPVVVDECNKINNASDTKFSMEFQVSTISRDDLESEGYYAANVPDHVMKKLASKIADGCQDTYWEVVHSYCRSNGIKTRHNIIDEATAKMKELYPDVELEYEDDGVFYLKDQYQDEFNSICDELEAIYLSKEI